MRVIITGETDNGRTVKVSEREVADLTPVTAAFGASFADVFCSDSPLQLPSDGSEAKYGPALFPGAGGFRFWIFTIPAHCAPLEPGPQTDAQIAAIRAVNPAYAAMLSANGDGMASADTIEWVLVLSGEVEHLLPDGQQFTLKQGDSIVQLGARHRWKNMTDSPCVMAVTAIGSERKTP